MTDHTNPNPPTASDHSSSSSSNNHPNESDHNYFVAAWRYFHQEIVSTTAPTMRRLSEYGATLHPGHVCTITSIPLLLHSYYGYYNYYSTHSEQLVQQHLLTKPELQLLKPPPPPVTAVVSPPPLLLDESIRRSLGVAVASRALRVATTGMIGVFTLAVGILFYSTGTDSVSQMLATLQQSSRRRLQQWEECVRPIFQSPNTNHNNSNNSNNNQESRQRYNENHPEYKRIQAMTEEEELEYIYQTYFQSSEQEEEGE